MRRAVVFEDRLLGEHRVMRDGHGRDQLQRRRLRDGRTPDVRIDLRPVRLRERDDVPRGRESTDRSEIGLRDVDGTGAEEIPEAVERVLVLATGDRHRDAAAHFAITLDVLRCDRLLVPAQVVVGERVAETDRVADAVRVVRVDHQRDALAFDRAADGGHHGDVVLQSVTELHLHRTETGLVVRERLVGETGRLALPRDPVEARRVSLHARAERAAQQAMHRHAVGLAGDVPEGDVDRADRGGHGALATVVAGHVIHAVPQHLDVERVRTDQQRTQRRIDHGGRDLRRLEPLGERLAPACDAFVGDDLDDRRGPAAHPALREREGRVERRAQRMDADVDDLHRSDLVRISCRTGTRPSVPA